MLSKREEPSVGSPRWLLRAHPEALLLYGVTDNAWLQGRTLGACCAQAAEGGVGFLQVRDKGASTDVLMREYLDVRASVEPCIPVVINDDVAAAYQVDADGVHVGQEDMACARAAELLGPNKIIGVSAQTVEQALEAQAQGADYLGVGALIPTATKPDAADVSREELQAICAAVSIPVVGIGGLNAQTMPVLSGTGVVGAAVVSAIFAADDIAGASSRLRKEVEHALSESC